MNNQEFQQFMQQKARELYRDMPWRQDTRGYYVLVSELMLQQTQVDRVIPKFEAFIAAFPDEHTLAAASLADVLRLWQGLGYNRRAKFLHQSAKMIVEQGGFPNTVEELMRLPGVGKNTAGAIMAYVFNKPAVYIETNVRTVYLHHFFANQQAVTDEQIAQKVTVTIDSAHAREFYWALMDYGSWLKQNGVTNVALSKHYRKQTPFIGSVREVRGAILRALAAKDYSAEPLRSVVQGDERFDVALAGLLKDGLVNKTNTDYHLT